MDKINMLLSSKKISIFGYPATGKTILANELGKKLNIKVYSLDKIRFEKEGSFIKRDPKSFEIEYKKIFKHVSWIIEGNALDYIDNRLEESDFLIFFKSNKYVSVLKYIIRSIKINIFKLEKRAGVNNNQDNLDLPTIRWILNRYDKKIKNLEPKLDNYENKILIIKSYRQLKNLIKRTK